MTSSEYFISLVEARRPLWDKSHKDYRNVNTRKRLWDEVGAICNMNGEDADAYFLSIRRKYIRRKKERANMALRGSTTNTIKPWDLDEHMKFLDDTITPRRTFSLLNVEKKTDETKNISFETTANCVNNVPCQVLWEEQKVADDPVKNIKTDNIDDIGTEESMNFDTAGSSTSTPSVFSLTSPTNHTPTPSVKLSEKRRKREEFNKIVTALSTPITIQGLRVGFEDDWEVAPEVKNFCKFLGCRLNEMSKKQFRAAQSAILQVVTKSENNDFNK